jgi:hypothetical protein
MRRMKKKAQDDGVEPVDGVVDAPEVADEALAIAETAAHLDEGPARIPQDSADHLTPDTLLGGHRDG